LNQPPRRVVKLHHTARRARVSLSHAHTRILSTTVSTPPERVRVPRTSTRSSSSRARPLCIQNRVIQPHVRNLRPPIVPRARLPRRVHRPRGRLHTSTIIPSPRSPSAPSKSLSRTSRTHRSSSNSTVPTSLARPRANPIRFPRAVARVDARPSSLDRRSIDRSIRTDRQVARREVARSSRTTASARALIINSHAPSV